MNKEIVFSISILITISACVQGPTLGPELIITPQDRLSLNATILSFEYTGELRSQAQTYHDFSVRMQVNKVLSADIKSNYTVPRDGEIITISLHLSEFIPFNLTGIPACENETGGEPNTTACAPAQGKIIPLSAEDSEGYLLSYMEKPLEFNLTRIVGEESWGILLNR